MVFGLVLNSLGAVFSFLYVSEGGFLGENGG